MRSAKDFLIAHARKLALLPQYLRAIKAQAWEIAWGESLPAIAFCLWWAMRSTPMPTLYIVLFFGGALMLAGYYTWRADHIRLIPKLDFHPQVITEIVPTLGGEKALYVQVLPRCLTDTPVEHCQGHLLRVLKLVGGSWESTLLNQPLDLMWSYHDSAPRTLYPGIDQRLNVLWVSVDIICPAVEPEQTPARGNLIFTTNDTFRFDVRVTAKDCPPIDISIRALVGDPRLINVSERYPRHIVV